MKRIKWENVLLVFLIPFCVYCIILHNTHNEFVWDLFLFEILIYSLIIGIAYIGAYGLRKELLKK